MINKKNNIETANILPETGISDKILSINSTISIGIIIGKNGIKKIRGAY